MKKQFATFIVVSLTAALLFSACGSKSRSAVVPGSPSSTVDIALKDFMILPMETVAKQGNLLFHVHNDGQTPHNFKVSQDGTILGGSKNLNPGQEQDVTVFLRAGNYIAYCSEPGHESLGMHSRLIVS